MGSFLDQVLFFIFYKTSLLKKKPVISLLVLFKN